MVARPDMSVDLGRLVLKNPVLAASGTFGYGQELADFCDPAGLGGQGPITQALAWESAASHCGNHGRDA